MRRVLDRCCIEGRWAGGDDLCFGIVRLAVLPVVMVLEVAPELSSGL